MSDAGAIHQMLSDWCEATNQPGEAGAEGYASYFTEDGVVLQPNVEMVGGREGIRAFALEFTGAADWAVTWEAKNVEVSSAGDTASAVGTYSLSLKDADGNPVEDRGSFLDTFRRQSDGSWRVSAVSFSSDLPAD